jgi:hypothetical protein
MKLSLMREDSYISHLKEFLMDVGIFLRNDLLFLIHDAICVPFLNVQIFKDFRVNNLRYLIEFNTNKSIRAFGSGTQVFSSI